METTEIVIQDKVDELLTVLEKDAEQLKQSLLRLNEMRTAVIKRNDSLLAKLLESVRQESQAYKSQASKRRLLIKELSAVLDCNFAELTLSKLESVLSGRKKGAIAERKKELRSLTRKLKTEHLATTRLLSECVRFNRSLLKSIFNNDITGVVTYDSKGSSALRSDRAFVNLEL
ncbi:MAG: hypothetical protein DRP65_03440 [Planctomycetota bacterium]|nr:MAG: hypothetical protein DRP65_03440 [Planctomycetota bacterium]